MSTTKITAGKKSQRLNTFGRFNKHKYDTIETLPGMQLNRTAIGSSAHFILTGDETLTEFGFAKLPSKELENVWYHPKHWLPVFKNQSSDYWAGEYQFKALTKQARQWAEDYPIQL